MKPLRTLILTTLTLLLLYTRLVGIDWGLPYPFHPDERNMADVITRLQCDLRADPLNCFEPGFYAYGQLPLYIGYVLAQSINTAQGTPFEPISFSDAVLALRLQSVFWSVGAGVLMLIIGARILKSRLRKSHLSQMVVLSAGLLFITFQTFFIEFAHFGTTESILMFLYLLIVLLTMRMYEKVSYSLVALIGFIVGISAGVKVSGAVYSLLPVSILGYMMLRSSADSLRDRVRKFARYVCILGLFGLLGMFVASPHYFIHIDKFLDSMTYEINLSKESHRVFYTRQFDHTIPLLYQLATVFPFLIGMPSGILFLGVVMMFSWKNANMNIIRTAIILHLVPLIGVFVKWGRFMAPILPLLTILVFVGFVELSIRFKKHMFGQLILAVLFISILVRGSAYLAVYTHEDVRIEASRWMYRHLPPSSRVLTEFGNIMSIPIADDQTRTDYSSPDVIRSEINMYEIDSNSTEAQKAQDELASTDYVVIASRRVFANFTCIWPADSIDGLTQIGHAPIGTTRDRCEKKVAEFPLVSDFFYQLTDPNQFTLIKTFTSYPRLTLSGKTLVEFPDEHAEEALTVFDHPVVRIYQRK